MNQLNSIIVEGNVTRDPEFKETAAGHKICIIPLAVNRFFKTSSGDGVKEVSYFDIETFGKMAENCKKNAEKGRGLRVVGRLKQNRWTDNEGKNRSSVAIVAEHIEFKPRATQTADSKKTNADELKMMSEANQSAGDKELVMQLTEEDENLAEAAVF